jgi:hypothetical protein
MEYHQEVLDRTTGRLETKSIGDWISVTELGELYGVGSRKVRAILHHMGVLGQEGRRYRLPRYLVEDGIGTRHDKPRSGYPFDVISPEGQDLVASVWAETVEDYEADCRKDRAVPLIRDSLAAFKTTRANPMTSQEEVCWIVDHFRDTPHRTIAEILEVSPALVIRYVKKRTEDRAYRERRKLVVWPEKDVLPAVGAEPLTVPEKSPLPSSSDE